ncbi:MAG: hypothetical protein A4E31_00411 [Methanomassiliicoccales archaeon PtaU1.Bin030]|nr:MAG: hypothetical protein A4E31_00411 [Methanomassiliicoccales archaeon PtaU1.Bin030]
MIEATWELAAFVLLAGLAGNLVRKYDPPITMNTVKEFVLGYGGALVTAALTTWGLIETGNFAIGYTPFLIVAGASVGGMSGARLLINAFAPKAEEK